MGSDGVDYCTLQLENDKGVLKLLHMIYSTCSVRIRDDRGIISLLPMYHHSQIPRRCMYI